MYYLCEKYYKPITVQYYVADCVSWVPRLTLLDLWTNWIYKCTLRMELVHMYGTYCTYIYIYIYLSIYLSIYHLSIYIYIYIYIYISPGMELLDHTVVLFLVSLRNLHTIFIVAVPIYISTNSVLGFLFLHILANIWYL